MTDTPWYMVVLLGMGIVFIGLGLLVLLCTAIRLLFSNKKTDQAAQTLSAYPEDEKSTDQIPDKKKLIAAITAAIAETENTDIRALRVVSFKRRTVA